MSALKEQENPEATNVDSIVSDPATPALASAGASRRPSAVASSSTIPAAAPAAPARPKSKKKKSQSGEGAAGENTGRWTAEEHRLFLQGLEQHGKGWKKIASLIKSRTVVQIRTHAQKYFQKLAKARQNGEEGDVTMEGRGDTVASASSVNPGGANIKRRQRFMTGTKRKAIQSVVNSVQRQGKKFAAAACDDGVPTLLPAVAPALAHFLLQGEGDMDMVDGILPPGSVSSASLEDALFRFLTPCPPIEPQVNDVAKKAGANPIMVPKDNKVAVAFDEGEASPTGVNDLSIYPPWNNSQDTPSWYAKGADVDALLDVADTLDWIADSGDPTETFQPPAMEDVPSMPDIVSHAGNDPEEEEGDDVDDELKPSASVNTLPRVDSTNVETMVPSLPSLFHSESTENLLASSNDLKMLASNACMLDAHLQVFENTMEEHAFVSTILDSSDDNLPSFA